MLPQQSPSWIMRVSIDVNIMHHVLYSVLLLVVTVSVPATSSVSEVHTGTVTVCATLSGVSDRFPVRATLATSDGTCLTSINNVKVIMFLLLQVLHVLELTMLQLL